MAPSKRACRCCWPHLRGLRPAQERTWGLGLGERGQSGPSPVRRSAVHGAKTVRHQLAAKTSKSRTTRPERKSGKPSQEGHHIRSGVEGHAPYIECRVGMNNRPSPAGLRVARWMRRFQSRYQARPPDVMVNAQADAQEHKSGCAGSSYLVPRNAVTLVSGRIRLG